MFWDSEFWTRKFYKKKNSYDKFFFTMFIDVLRYKRDVEALL